MIEFAVIIAVVFLGILAGQILTLSFILACINIFIILAIYCAYHNGYNGLEGIPATLFTVLAIILSISSLASYAYNTGYIKSLELNQYIVRQIETK